MDVKFCVWEENGLDVSDPNKTILPHSVFKGHCRFIKGYGGTRCVAKSEIGLAHFK